MVKGQRHIDNNGNIGVCRASDASKCPYDGNGGHFDTREEAEAAYGALQENGGIPESFKRARDPKSDGFSLEKGGYYGDVPPRSIQIDALNDTAQALIEDGNTQLVAACGTGKSFMGRQLMRRMMEEEDANGVAIVLTSSVKLAQDTAADLKPDGQGNYDQAMGEYEKDYNVQVIEVHNESRDVKTNGAIDLEKIASQWQEALNDGKRVVVVSTYQSAELVQKVQSLIGERAEADLLMNDEAHNILGQKKSVSSSADAENSGYRSFANEIPGAIQAKHRLYATATPSLADSPDDDETAAKGATREEQIASLQAQAARMSANGKERLTVYSDDALIVGRVSGAITQQMAINAPEGAYLTTPDYQLRSAVVKVDSADAPVDHRGEPLTKGDIRRGSAMTAQTYSAVNATLQAMTEDPKTDETGKVHNPVHNALAYTGSIAQANAFKENFRAVALEQSAGISLEDAQAHRNSSDPELRRRARMRLLAEHAQAEAAHSGNSVEEKKEAFSMFRGKTYTAEEGGWSPNKRVLANVDIFSEGVSINEIDTVVIADQAKTSERAMTQAIGRSLRTIGGNTDKNTGHVIIPQVMSESGKELNGGLVTAASYGATRVERAVSTRKLKGEAVAADESTMVSRFDSTGRLQGSELAASIAKTHVKSSEDLVASQVMERAHTALMSRTTPDRARDADRYAAMSPSEKLVEQRNYIANQAESLSTKDPSWAVANKALSRIGVSDMPTVRQSGRVVTAALSAGDFSAVPDSVISGLTRSGIIRKRQGRTDELTADEKTEFLSKSSGPAALALGSPFARSVDPAVAAQISQGVDFAKAGKYAANPKSGQSADYDRLVTNYEQAVKTMPSFRDRAFEIVAKSSEAPAKGSPEERIGGLLGQWGRKLGTDVNGDLLALRSSAKARSAAAASSGEAGYEIDPTMVQKNGVLKATAQRKLSEVI